MKAIFSKRHRKKPHFTLLIAAALFGAAGLAANLAGCRKNDEKSQNDLRIYAAASMTELMLAAGKAFEAESGEKVAFNFAGSSTLARQIENGAPAAIFLSANLAWMDYLDEKGLLEPGSRFILATNRAAILVPSDSKLKVEMSPDFDFPGAFDGPLAIGDPLHVPAGIYGKQVLQSLGWWEGLENRLARSASVRDAVSMVERGECRAGVAYVTDARVSDKVKVAALFPPEASDPIRYAAAIVKGAEEGPARRFAIWLQSPGARALIEKFGFGVPE